VEVGGITTSGRACNERAKHSDGVPPLTSAVCAYERVPGGRRPGDRLAGEGGASRPGDRHAHEDGVDEDGIYDDARMRGMRVTRMIEGYAIAAVDAARTVRTVSRFVPTYASDQVVVVRSAQVLVAYKRGRHDLWAAEVKHRVRLSA